MLNPIFGDYPKLSDLFTCDCNSAMGNSLLNVMAADNLVSFGENSPISETTHGPIIIIPSKDDPSKQQVYVSKLKGNSYKPAKEEAKARTSKEAGSSKEKIYVPKLKGNSYKPAKEEAKARTSRFSVAIKESQAGPSSSSKIRMSKEERSKLCQQVEAQTKSSTDYKVGRNGEKIHTLIIAKPKEDSPTEKKANPPKPADLRDCEYYTVKVVRQPEDDLVEEGAEMKTHQEEANKTKVFISPFKSKAPKTKVQAADQMSAYEKSLLVRYVSKVHGVDLPKEGDEIDGKLPPLSGRARKSLFDAAVAMTKRENKREKKKDRDVEK